MASDFTVERNSSKWVLGADGYLKEYIADAPAIEFNADGSYKGVLVEPQSINEARANEDLDNATYWDDSGDVSIAGDTETDPKGGANSFLLSEDATTSTHLFQQDSSHRVSVTSGETWTSSVYLKKGSGANAPDIVQLTHLAGGFGSSQYANFNLATGVVADSLGGTASIRDYGNGWYRCSWTADATNNSVNGFVVAFTNNNPTATRLPSYAGQTDANVFIWGAQLEASPIATSYIPTTTGAVTRLKDDIYLTSASSLIGQTEGTLFIEVDWQETDGSNQYLLALSDGTVDNRIAIVKDDGNSELRMIIESNNVLEVYQGESYSTYSGIQKFAMAYAQNDVELYRNGSSISTDTSADLSSLATLDEIDFANRDFGLGAGNQANMWIRAVALYTTRLSDAECEELTS